MRPDDGAHGEDEVGAGSYCITIRHVQPQGLGFLLLGQWSVGSLVLGLVGASGYPQIMIRLKRESPRIVSTNISHVSQPLD